MTSATPQTRLLQAAFALMMGLLVLPASAQQRAPQTRTAEKANAVFNLYETIYGAPYERAWGDPYVSPPSSPAVSPAVRSLPTRTFGPMPEGKTVNPRGTKAGMRPVPLKGARSADALRGRSANDGRTPDPLLSFDGIGATGAVPPDPVLAVGPNHLFEMVNSVFAIYDKNGNLLQGPNNIDDLWQGQGGICDGQNAGDPIAVYDQDADQWLVSQFAFPSHMCIAISQTGDPTGAYNLYEFNVIEFPDYFKFGIWTDGYYFGANTSQYSALAFDRASMLVGAPAQFVRFNNLVNFPMPADIDGATLPPSGTPGMLYTFLDSGFHGGGPDRIELYEFNVNWAQPNTSTLVLAETFVNTPFNFTVCGFFNFNCVPQPGTNQRLDSVSEWPMFKFAYRNFGTYQSMVGNFAIDVSGSQQAGIRWFELRNDGTGWALEQEGTHAPDNLHRWMGSIAQDGDGNIALAYSVSSSNQVFPGLRYTVHEATDPAGTMQTEAVLQNGGGAQTSFDRWGDYATLDLDPADDATFWYVGEYYKNNSSSSWSTRIGSFKVGTPGGGGDDVTITCAPQNPPVIIPAGGGSYAYDVSITNNGTSSANTDIWLTIQGPGLSIVTRGPFNVTLNAGATLGGVLNQNVPAGAPANTYTQLCSVGTFDVADASDSFTWEKAASKGNTTVAVADWDTDGLEALLADDALAANVPQDFALEQNYPNPFNPITLMGYTLREPGTVSLKVFNTLGQTVATLVEGHTAAGRHEVRFDATHLPAGVYLYVLDTPAGQQTRHMVLLK